MAEDKGDGGGAASLPLFGGALGGALGGVAMASGAMADIVTELESFTKFQQRVDQLIKDLSGSDAGSKKIGQEPLGRHQFGGGAGDWGDAAGLFTSYETVLTELENLSKILSDSIEGMGIAVLASHKGYAAIDADLRDRVAAIKAETKDHYGGDYDPEKSKLWHQGAGPAIDEIGTKDGAKDAAKGGQHSAGAKHGGAEVGL
ncbi:hypothetical protein EOT10_15910 [Streptomyces antnestii]|uniref:Uncharacterized protein n=1 Tax=Streptomyces antnestii TaxID=2494256 RepID=A0A3S2VXN4_9ACTN|nr:hypothetical protein [Streptomyces sp. San01]RVU24485.1 hypothetical protein EOT10_15910 [Streptomyces sp. San01]